MANNIDFILRNGLQVMSNVVIGSYATQNAAPVNGMIISGNVGIGTTTVRPGNVIAIHGNECVYGNINIGNAYGIGSTGINFPDGTFQYTAATTGVAAGSQYSVQLNNGSGIFTSGALLFNNGTNSLGIGTSNITVYNNALQVFGTSPAWFSATNGSNPEVVIGNTPSSGLILGFNPVGSYGFIQNNVATTGYPALVVTNTGAVTIGNAVSTTNQMAVVGNVAIGTTYASLGAPANGLIVQGSVGIGTSGPGSTLDVNGYASIRNDLSVAGAFNANSIHSNTNVVATNIQSTGLASVGSLVSNTTITAGTGLVVSAGGATISGNLNIMGNIYISGNSYVTEANVLVVGTPIIFLAGSNPGNTYDIGTVGEYVSGNSTIYTGLVLNHSTEQWTLFNSLTTSPTTTVNWSDPSLKYGNMLIGNLSVSGNSASTNYITGAIVVPNNGGVGIGGNLNVNGQIYTGGVLNSGGQTIVNSLIVNTSTTTSSLNITNALTANSINSNTNVVATNLQSTGTATVNSLTSNVTITSPLVTVTSTVASTSDTTGAVIVTGGAGILGNINVGGSVNLFYGNVGIGTSTPTGLHSNVFSVYGTTNQTGNIVLSNLAAGGSGVYFADGTFQSTAATSTPSYGTPGTIQYAAASNTFSGNSSSLFWSTSLPGLGLGTTTPGSLLDVQGAANVSGPISVGGTATASAVVSNTSVTSYTVIWTGNAAASGNTATTSGTSQINVDAFTTTTYRTAHYIVQVTDNTNNQYHSTQIMLIHDGTNVYKTEYNEIYTVTMLGSFDANITGGVLSLQFTPTIATNKTLKMIRTAVNV